MYVNRHTHKPVEMCSLTWNKLNKNSCDTHFQATIDNTFDFGRPFCSLFFTNPLPYPSSEIYTHKKIGLTHTNDEWTGLYALHKVMKLTILTVYINAYLQNMLHYNVFNANHTLLNIGKFNPLPRLNPGLKHFITIWNIIAGSVSHTFV